MYWLGFILLNALHFLPNFLINASNSSILPYWTDLKSGASSGIIASLNQDPFRYVNELSLLFLMSRWFNLSAWSTYFSWFYFLLLVFNWYQYLFRRIYETEPIFYGDIRLLKNGLVIVWHESPWKVVVFGLLFIGISAGFVQLVEYFFVASSKIAPSNALIGLGSIWLLLAVFSTVRLGIYRGYPNDVYNRFHFTTAELLANCWRSFQSWSISLQRIGRQIAEERKGFKMFVTGHPPNVHFIFIESYGSYLFKDPSIGEEGVELLRQFQTKVQGQGRQMLSHYSTSPTTGGQSWLTYSSFLYGLKIADNTHFEKYLRDPDFRWAKSILQLFQSAGYLNYNLNPISPIKGINVPYDAMREFYSIDHWFLKEDLQYQGDVYGFGECPPDQYSLNFALDYILSDHQGPFTLFYLTKNSHSPFIPPTLVKDWRSLNDTEGKAHIHRGFLAHPKPPDYLKSIAYEFDVLVEFMSRCDPGDVFLLIGDHQPPILSNPERFGLETPVHIVSGHEPFLAQFRNFGFQEDLQTTSGNLSHEGLYDLFLQAFAGSFCDPEKTSVRL
ncbi:MAG: hypothetical protein AAGA85_05200 [Bacteroidota bacterium]